MNIKRKLIFSTALSLLLLSAAVATAWLGHRAIIKGTITVSSLKEQTSHLQVLFRGINESILTGGTPYSIEIAKRGMADFDDTHRRLIAGNYDSHLQAALTNKIAPRWKIIKDSTKPFLQLNSVNINDDEMMIQYGEVLSTGELLVTDIRSAIGLLQLEIDSYIRNIRYAVFLILLSLFTAMLVLQLELYSSIAVPINKLRALMENLFEEKNGEPGNQSEIISTSLYENENRFTSRVSDVQTLAVAFSMLIKRINTQIEERKQVEEELKILSSTDKLTQAYNRAKFDELITNEMMRAERYQHPLSMVLLDIDDFKMVNDTHGHIAGDSVLVSIVEIMNRTKRAVDYVVRWGGEEFLLLTPEIDIEGAEMLAERLRNAVEGHKFGSNGNITISLGVTQFRQGDTEDSFIKRADDALYKAKTIGKNHLEVNL